MKYYLKSFISTIRFRSRYLLINIVALALCMSIALMLVLYVDFEQSYDTFHDHQRVYRVESRLWEGSRLTDNWATTSYGHAPMMEQEIPGIETTVRVTAQDREQVVSFEDKAYAETRYAYTEPSFFEVFNYPIIEGDSQDPLGRPATVVISRSAAARYFGSSSPLGQKLTFRNPRSERTFEITAVMEDMPLNSNLHYDFLLSYTTITPSMRDVWYIHGVYTYVKLREGVPASRIEDTFAARSVSYRPKALQHKDWRVELVPLADIHLRAQKPYEKEAKGNAAALPVLIIMAAALMAVAWLNILNFVMAKSLGRVREFILRRIYGAWRVDTAAQFLFDAVLINLISALLAVGLVFVMCPLVAGFMGITIDAVGVFSPFMLSVFALMVVVGSLVVGLYPSLVLMRVKIVEIMRGNFSSSRSSQFVRRVLVGSQFAASFVLIAGTLIVYSQLSFMQSQPLGVDTDNVVVLKYPPLTDDMNNRIDGFRSSLLSSAHVSDVSVSGAVPGMEVANYFAVRLYGEQPSEGKLMQMLVCDTHYPSLFGFEMLAGGRFVPNAPGQRTKVLINEEALSLLGFSSPNEAIGKLLSIEVVRDSLEISGVARNFHQQALGEPYKPIVLLAPELLPMVSVPYISIRVADGNRTDDVMAAMCNLYAQYFPLSPPDYFMLSDFYSTQYRAEHDFFSMFTVSAILTLCVALIGLWVMSLFSIRRLFKELCLRKIYGAEAANLYWIVVREILVLWVIATLIGSVVSWYVMHLWLSTYAFQVSVGWWIFPISALLLLAAALLTVMREMMRATRCNPVDLFCERT